MHANRIFRPSALLLFGAICFAVGLGALLPAPVSAQTEPTPLPLYALPDPRQSTSISSNMLALAPDNRTLVVANMLNSTLSVVLPGTGELVAEIPVGKDPRSVALLDDGLHAVTANRGDDTLSLVDLQAQTVTAIPLGGSQPYGVIMGANQHAYVSLQGSAEVVEVDVNAGTVLRRIPVEPFPSGLALWGDFLYVTHFWSGDLSLIYLPQNRVIAVAHNGRDSGISQAVELDITRGLAYLPQTRSNADEPHPTYDTLVFPVVNVVSLRDLALQRGNRLTLDTADQPVNMPFAVALDRFREWLFVANAGSNDVSVIDLKTGLARAHIPVGANPRGILLNHDNSLVFVYNALEGTLTVIETRNLTVINEIPISDFNIPVDIIIGSQLFYSAADPRLSADRWVSCANCHFDGLSDGRVWHGFPDGARSTPPLYGLLETPPYNAAGTWDEVADVELKIRSLQAGSGLITDGPVSAALGDPHSRRSLDLDVLVSYLSALQGPPAPPPADAAQAERGAAVFTEQGCESCHVGAVGTDLKRYDVGTGGEFDTPSLRYLWLSAPYLHDGAARTLTDVFRLPGAHQLALKVLPQDIDALVAYLQALPTPP